MAYPLKIIFRQILLQQFVRYCFCLAVFKTVKPGFKTYRLQEIKPDMLSLEWNYDGQKVQAIFNQSTENYLIDSESVALVSHCEKLDQQLVILPKGFVIQ